MSGPCLCGDPMCGSCFPGQAERIEAEEAAVKKLADAQLSPDEYDIAVTFGLACVVKIREGVKRQLADFASTWAADKAEEAAMDAYYRDEGGGG